MTARQALLAAETLAEAAREALEVLTANQADRYDPAEDRAIRTLAAAIVEWEDRPS